MERFWPDRIARWSCRFSLNDRKRGALNQPTGDFQSLLIAVQLRKANKVLLVKARGPARCEAA
jgi:hypothetical protein